MADSQVKTTIVKTVNRAFAAWFRLRKGQASFRGAPTCILHTTGAKTGQPRQTPLLFLGLDQDRMALVGSYAGSDHTPAWVHNLRKNPDVEVEVGASRRAMTAEIADDATRDELWPRLVAMYADYAAYQAKTTRKIPVIILTPR